MLTALLVSLIQYTNLRFQFQSLQQKELAKSAAESLQQEELAKSAAELSAYSRAAYSREELAKTECSHESNTAGRACSLHLRSFDSRRAWRDRKSLTRAIQPQSFQLTPAQLCKEQLGETECSTRALTASELSAYTCAALQRTACQSQNARTRAIQQEELAA